LNRIYDWVGEACWACGYSKGPAGRRVLDFHHVVASEKSFPLDCRHVVNLAWDRVVAEVRKCVLLCANCHRETEAGLIAETRILALYETNWARLALDPAGSPA
jgi:hypothetical protein